MSQPATSKRHPSIGRRYRALCQTLLLAVGSAGCFWLCYRLQMFGDIGNLWVAVPMDVLAVLVCLGPAMVASYRLRKTRYRGSWAPGVAVVLTSILFLGFMAWREQGWVYYRDYDTAGSGGGDAWRVNRNTGEEDLCSGPIEPLGEPFSTYDARERKDRVTRREWER